MSAKDTRIWARLSVDFSETTKVEVLSDAAFRALVEMILWSRKHLTDGVVPARVAERRWGVKTQSVSDSVSKNAVLETQSVSDPLLELCSNDPVSPSITRDENGDYVIHDFLEHQESAADVKARLARNSANGKKGGRPRKTQSVSIDAIPKTQSVSDSVSKNAVLETQSKSRVQSTEIEVTNVTSIVGAQTRHETQSKTQSVSRGTRLPDDWTPSPELADWTRAHAPVAATDTEVERFRDYWAAQPGAKGRKASWDATWRNWARRCQEQAHGGYRSQSQVMADVRAQAMQADATRQGSALTLIEGAAL